MDPATIGATPYPFTGDGDNVVDKPRYDDGKVWINKTQYFADVPEVSWGFYIGGYQPCASLPLRWAKDAPAANGRKVRTSARRPDKHAAPAANDGLFTLHRGVKYRLYG